MNTTKNISQELYHKPAVSPARSFAQPAFFRVVPLYFVLMAVGSAVGVAKNLIFAKVLSVSDFGYLALFMVLSSYGANFIHLGLLNGLNRELPVAIAQGDEERALWLRNMVLTGLGLVVLMALAPYMVAVLLWGEGLTTKSVLLAAYAAATVMVIYNIAALELRGRQMLVPFSLSYMLQGLFILGAGTAGGIYWGLKGVIWAVILGNLFTVFTAWTLWLSPIKFVWPQKKEIRYMLSIGVPLLVSLLCTNLVISMDRLFVAALFGFTELGYYQFGAMIFVAGQVFAGIIGQWLVPQVLYDHGRGVSPETNFHRVLIVMAVISGVFLLGWYPFVKVVGVLIERFFPQYYEAVSFVNIFYLSAGFATVNLASVILNAMNKQRLIMAGAVFVTALLALVYLGAGLLRAPLIAFAWIFLIGQAMMFAVNLWLVYRYLGLQGNGG